jgi:glucose/arabinose dehydrogenase
VQNTFTTSPAPNGIAQIGNSLYVLCQDSFGGLEGAIYEFDIQSVSLADNFELNLKPGKDLVAGPDDKLYFYSGSSIYSSDFNNAFNEVEDKLAFTNAGHESVYGLGISSEGDIWIGDARGFTENGRVYRYGSSGELLNNWTSGIGPNGFVFF